MTSAADAVGAALREFGEELSAAGAAQVGGAFTDDPRADDFLKASPEAFLIGVLFTQGVRAERAWAAPWALRERLGHLDLRRLADEPEAVAAAVVAPPALHRFVGTLPRWISSAARRLLDSYGGDATRIWAAGSGVTEVTARLEAFDGIGRKKAAMTVEILRRHFGADLRDEQCGRVAYDVHVRRVFLRSGLVDSDTPEAVEDAARRAYPACPGLLDLPAWLVGRQWCRPQAPECEACRLGEVCARRVDLGVRGVGVRGAGGSQSSERKSSPEGSLG